MNTATIQETIRLWQAEPTKAQVKPLVRAHSDGPEAVFESGSFTWRCDLPASLGGSNAAPSPTALFLSSLAGCAVVFIRDTLAPQMGVRVESVTAVAQCDADFRGLLGMDHALPDLENLRLVITIQSPDEESQIHQLAEVWRQRCPIYLALTKGISVDMALEIKKHSS